MRKASSFRLSIKACATSLKLRALLTKSKKPLSKRIKKFLPKNKLGRTKKLLCSRMLIRLKKSVANCKSK